MRLTEWGWHVGGRRLLLLDGVLVADGAEALVAWGGVEAAAVLAEGRHVLLHIWVAGVHPDVDVLSENFNNSQCQKENLKNESFKAERYKLT